MNLDESLLRVLRGVCMIGGTGIVQVAAQLLLAKALETLPLPRYSTRPKVYMLSHSVVAVLILMAGHILQVTLWALLYRYDWNELGSFDNALYFSLASFTTVGAGELSLSHAHRMVGALESAAGMLMFGWSTALLVQVVQRTDSSSRRRT